MALRRSISWMIPLALFAGPALAQTSEPTQAQTPAAVATANNLSVNESFTDWTVRCFQVRSIAPCDIVQVASNKDTNQRVLLVSIAYVPSRDAYAMQMIVPLGVALPKGMTLDAGGKALTGVAFNRCERDGCYIEIPVPNETMQTIASAGKTSSISLVPYGKTEAIKLPLSLNGFGEALNKMKAYARDKAINPPAQP